jgi:pyruvate dehydrogenase (quinone)
MNGRPRLIGSFLHGSMANAMPQAIGAQAAFPDRQVIALSGDGGIAMLLGDLITLRQHRLPVEIVVFNNGALAFVELEMMSAGIPKWGTDLNNPDFAEVPHSVGLYGVRVERPDELRPALQAVFENSPATTFASRPGQGPVRPGGIRPRHGARRRSGLRRIVPASTDGRG